MAEFEWDCNYSGMPSTQDDTFTEGETYTGLPYSSVKHIGRSIGEDIFFKTFVAALSNPQSVLYTENLSEYGEQNPGGGFSYYGIVCSKLTGYAYRNGIATLSRFYIEDKSDITELHSLDSTTYDISIAPPRIGDLILYEGHTRIIINVIKDINKNASFITVAESIRPTAKTLTLNKETFEGSLNSTSLKKGLYRILNFDSWLGNNVAWTFPDYERELPTINSVLLLDRGDWVPYKTTEPVKINIMDSNAETLIVRSANYRRKIHLNTTGVTELSIDRVGQYEAYCQMKDGSESQHCEFAICKSTLTVENSTSLDASTDITLSWDVKNAIPRFIHVRGIDDEYAQYFFFLNSTDRESGSYIIPGGTVDYSGSAWIILVSENQLGRIASHIFDAVFST